LPVLALILFGLPLLEIAVFVIVGSKIGVLWTVALVVLAAIAGAVLLRIQGFGVLGRIRRELDAGRDPGRSLAHGGMILLAGLLLVIPGFVSDLFGLLLFIPPVRDFVWGQLRRRITVTAFDAGFGHARRRDGRTIDLDAEDFHRTAPDPKSPWRIGTR
jgi:UPF0716 protein FxsA